MTQEKLLKLYGYWTAGDDAYRQGRHLAAAELYRKAMEIADSFEESDDAPLWFRGVMRRAFADELVTTERLREALAVLAVLPKGPAEGYEACCIYGSMTDHIEIAQRLPVSLRAIERAYARAEEYLRSAGERDWAGRLLHYKSELLYDRGLYREARDAAREGLTMTRKSCPKIFPVTHAFGLFRISLALGDLAEAGRCLDRWAALYEADDKKSVDKAADEYLMRSMLARASGEAEAALDHARRGAARIDLIDWGETRYAMNVELVRACLASGRLAPARVVLGGLRSLRRSENGHWRYAFALLRGDYYLAVAREEAGLGAADEEFAAQRPGEYARPRARPGGAGMAAARAALGRARRAYGRAREVGVWIDSQLECSVRREEVGGRLARLASVAEAAGEVAAASVDGRRFG